MSAFSPPSVLLALLIASQLAILPAAAAAPPEIALKIRARETIRLDHDFDRDAADANNFATLRTRLGFGFGAGAYAAAFIELQDSRVLGEAPGTTSSLDRVDLHQGYLELRNSTQATSVLQLGRYEMSYGSSRQIGRSEWSDVGRSFDGARARFELSDFGWMHLWALKTQETGGPQFGPSRPTTGAAAESAFLGGSLHYEPTEESALELYLLDLYSDHGDGGSARGSSNLLTAGLRVDWDGRSTGWQMGAEAAYQFGATPDSLIGGENIAGSEIQAWAAVARIRRYLPARIESWLEFELNAASGDPDPTDSTLETYNQL